MKISFIIAGLLITGSVWAEQPANYISIGNSFSLRVSYGKSAVGQVGNIAELTGRAKPAYTNDVFLSNRGGSHLYDHLNGIAELPPYWWSDNGTNRGIVWDSLPSGQTWDFVVIQGYNDAWYNASGYTTNDFPINMAELYTLTANHSPDVVPVLYEIWAYNTNGFPTMDQQARRELIYNIYQKSLTAVTNAGAQRARVAHVGEAFAQLGWEDSLYEPTDWYHPSYSRGSLLIGMVLYATAYNDDLSDIQPDAAVSNLMNYMESGYDLTGADWTQLVAVADSVTWPNGRGLLSTNTLHLAEGTSNTFQACLSRNPSGTVQVAVSVYKGADEVSVASGTNLTFDSSNWDQWQNITVSAVQDGDINDEEARLELVTQTMGSRDLWAQVQDDGILSVFTNTLTVASAHGTPVPAAGAHQIISTQSVACSVSGSPIMNGATSIVCTGWTLTGNDPVSGSGTNFNLTLTNNAVLTWLWVTNVPAVTTNTLTIASARGLSDPAPGVYTYTNGVISCSITGTVVNGSTQYVCAGWSLNGNSPASGTTTGLTVVLTNDAVLTWLWRTNFQFAATAGLHGSLTGSADGWYSSASNVTVTAVADSGYGFAGWSGDVPTGNTNENPLTLTMDQPRSITSSFKFMTSVAVTNTLRLDFGLTNAPVEIDGSWQEFACPYTTTALSTNRTYGLGGSNVTVTLTAAGVLTGRDRLNPSADSGALTYSSVYRDLVQTASGTINLTVTGLHANAQITLRTWMYDWQYAGGNIFSLTDITAGRSNLLGQVTNVTGNPAMPTNNLMYSVGGSMTAANDGTLTLLFGGNVPARLNGLEILEVIYQEIPVTNTYTLSVGNAAGGSASPSGGVYDEGTDVILTAAPSNYYRFTGWSGDVTSTNNPLTVTMISDITVTAGFADVLLTNDTPQAWLAQHGLSTNDAGALSDTDSDGLAAWQEYIAGTLPNLGDSVLEISNHWKTPDGSGMVVVWPVVEGRAYSVHWSSNLTSGIWLQIADTASGVYTDAVHGADAGGFYRIKVRMSP